MFGRFIRIAAVVAIVLGLATGAAFSADTVKIGTLVPLTGAAAADGLSALNSMKIAVDIVNSEGGILGQKTGTGLL